MKTLFLTVAAAALIFAAPTAFAADNDHDKGHPGGGQHADHAAPVHTDHTGSARTDHMAPGGNMAPAMTMSGPTHTDRRSHHGLGNMMAAPGASQVGVQQHGHKGDNGFNGNAMHGGDNMRGMNNNRGRGNNTHVTINFNRHNVSASHHFHYRGGAYRGPSGYSYHRYSYGQMLPSIYFAQNYWISDYDDYGLVPPPEGAVWVRYGDDAILIDQYSGEILEVVYGQFY